VAEDQQIGAVPMGREQEFLGGVAGADLGVQLHVVLAGIGLGRPQPPLAGLLLDRALLVDLADGQGLKVNTPRDPERRGGMVCVDFPGSERVHDQLLRRGFLVDWRPGSGIRLSPHFYTTDAEIVSILDEIRKLRPKVRAQ